MDPGRFEKILVSPDATVRDAVLAIDAGAVEIALVVDAERRLAGTVSDGDVRRALLRGVTLDSPVSEVAHTDPISAPAGTDRGALLKLMVDRSIEQVPLIEDGRVVDLAFIRELLEGDESAANAVLIMAGGEGQRLRPLTEDVPKPMLPVGDKPLLETMLDQIKGAGFSRILMSVNYRSEAIEEYFGSGEDRGLDIDYVKETERLGSAGALQLVRDRLDQPFIVVNADLLTQVNLSALLRFHREEGNVLTIGVRQYELEVPYGVVNIDGTRVTGIEEKPHIGLFVNTGIYAVSPEAVALLPEEMRAFDMTELIERVVAADMRVGAFPVREYWLDIGQLADYERAHSDHATYFTRS